MNTNKFYRFIAENPWVGFHFNAEEEESNAWVERLDYIAFRTFSSLCLDNKSVVSVNYFFSPRFSLVPDFMPWSVIRYGIWYHREGERFAERSITVGFSRKEETIKNMMNELIKENTLDAVVKIREAGDNRLMMFANSVEIFRVPIDFKL